MTYRPIASTETDPDSPVTATLMVALAENHLAVTQLESTAIAEGEVNGAQFYPHALVTGAGDTDAQFYDHGTDGTVASVLFDLGADKLLSFEYELVFVELSGSGSATNNILDMRFFQETTGSFTAWTALSSPFVAAVADSGKIRF